LPWVATEFEMSESAVNRFMRVYEKFGDKSVIMTDFNPTVIYELAAPSTDDEVIEGVVEKAKKGEKVTVAEVKLLKKELAEAKKANDSLDADVAMNNLAQKNLQRMYDDSKQELFTLQSQNDVLKRATAEKVEVEVEKPLDEYEEYRQLQEQYASLESELAVQTAQQEKLIKKGVNNELSQRAKELTSKQNQLDSINEAIKLSKEQMDSFEGRVHNARSQREDMKRIIDDLSFGMANLATYDLEDHMPELDKEWRKVSDMLKQYAKGIEMFLEG
jgi:chromosome segregation ATPase